MQHVWLVSGPERAAAWQGGIPDEQWSLYKVWCGPRPHRPFERYGKPGNCDTERLRLPKIQSVNESARAVLLTHTPLDACNLCVLLRCGIRCAGEPGLRVPAPGDLLLRPRGQVAPPRAALRALLRVQGGGRRGAAA
eukprot:611561-Pleurochrysis_carterae.AAC.1